MILSSVLEELAVWHGALMVAVTRAFGVWGLLRPGTIPDDVLDELRVRRSFM